MGWIVRGFCHSDWTEAFQHYESAFYSEQPFFGTTGLGSTGPVHIYRIIPTSGGSDGDILLTYNRSTGGGADAFWQSRTITLVSCDASYENGVMPWETSNMLAFQLTPELAGELVVWAALILAVAACFKWARALA